jgi:hypothetical protein
MTDSSEGERLCHLTHIQSDLVLNEVRLAAEAVGRAVENEEYEIQDDANVFHVSRGRPTALIIPFPGKTSGR